MIDDLFQIDPKLFGSPFRWLIFYDKKKKDILKSINALIDSNVLLVEKLKDGFELNHVYRIDPGTEMIFQKYGTWNKTDKIVDERKTKVLCKSRVDFRGRTITTSHVILHNNSFNHLTDYGERVRDALSKINYMVIKDFIPIFNATQKENFYDTWGWLDNVTKRFTAMIGDVLYRRADIGCNLSGR
jgi:hypothetical protein